MSVSSRRCRSTRACPTSPSPDRVAARLAALVRLVGVAGELAADAAPRPRAVHHVDDALLRIDQRRELRQQQLADRDQVALSLHHAAELREVGLQPVLLGVALGGRAQVADHGVDVVLELGHLAARLDLDRARQVALGHRGGHLGDGAHLVGQIGGQQVDVGGQVLPGAGRARARAPGRRGGLRRRPRAPRWSPGRRRSRACRSCC